MRKYIYDTHVHTSEVSHCGRMPAAEVVRQYIDARYSGLIVTDHLSWRSYRTMSDAPWDEKVTHFLKGYDIAKQTAAALDPDFTVLLGAELRLDCNDDNDYLLYGVDEAFLRSEPTLLQMDFEQMAACVRSHGLLLVQAHPFREDMQIMDWRLLDGVEVYNGNSSHNSNNCIADAWADRHHLLKTSGSDFHGMWGMRPGGIVTEAPVTSNAELLEVLRGQQYRLA